MSSKEISVSETARRLDVGIGHIYVLIWSGKLAARKIDGRWMVSEESVHARLEGEKRNGRIG